MAVSMAEYNTHHINDGSAGRLLEFAMTLICHGSAMAYCCHDVCHESAVTYHDNQPDNLTPRGADKFYAVQGPSHYDCILSCLIDRSIHDVCTETAHNFQGHVRRGRLIVANQGPLRVVESVRWTDPLEELSVSC